MRSQIQKDNVGQQIRVLVANNDFKRACELLYKTSFSGEAYGLTARVNALDKKIREGTIRIEEEELENNQIRVALLKIAAELDEITEVSIPQNNSPIKGLQAFEPSDAELFRQLERQQDINFFVQTFPNNDFTIGLLSGVSGAGKTSFLQAGLLPALQEIKHQVVYVKFSDASPLKSIQPATEKALNTKLTVPKTFLELLQKIASNSKKTIFIFDQFEQFFTHHRTKKEREDFLNQLKEWYQQRDQYPIKVLFSVRSDMIYFCMKFRKCLVMIWVLIKIISNLKNSRPIRRPVFSRSLRSKEPWISMKNSYTKCVPRIIFPRRRADFGGGYSDIGDDARWASQLRGSRLYAQSLSKIWGNRRIATTLPKRTVGYADHS